MYREYGGQLPKLIETHALLAVIVLGAGIYNTDFDSDARSTFQITPDTRILKQPTNLSHKRSYIAPAHHASRVLCANVLQDKAKLYKPTPLNPQRTESDPVTVTAPGAQEYRVVTCSYPEDISSRALQALEITFDK